MRGTVLAVANQKGGVGKTTTAVNLVACFGLMGKKSLLVDLDAQANATSGVGAGRARGGLLEAWLVRGRSMRGDVVATKYDGVWLVPSSGGVAKPEAGAWIGGKELGVFQERIGELVREFDFVIFDCPPSLGALPELALGASDGVVVPVQCEYYAMEGLSQILPEIERVRQTANPRLEIDGLLMTMYSEELVLSREVVEEVRGYFKELVYETVIPRDVSLAEASSHGQAIVEYDVSSRGAWGYIQLAKEIVDHGRAKTGAGAGRPDSEAD